MKFLNTSINTDYLHNRRTKNQIYEEGLVTRYGPVVTRSMKTLNNNDQLVILEFYYYFFIYSFIKVYKRLQFEMIIDI